MGSLLNGLLYSLDFRGKGWIIKAGLLQGDIEKYSVGQEEYSLTSLKDQLSHALAMAEQYTAMAETTGPAGSAPVTSGVILKISKPEVI